jgi:hypothetical protein
MRKSREKCVFAVFAMGSPWIKDSLSVKARAWCQAHVRNVKNYLLIPYLMCFWD